MGVPNQTVYRDPWAKREAWRQVELNASPFLLTSSKNKIVLFAFGVLMIYALVVIYIQHPVFSRRTQLSIVYYLGGGKRMDG